MNMLNIRNVLVVGMLVTSAAASANIPSDSHAGDDPADICETTLEDSPSSYQRCPAEHSSRLVPFRRTSVDEPAKYPLLLIQEIQDTVGKQVTYLAEN